MARSTLLKYSLLIFCLGAANLRAQTLEMIPPPIPQVVPSPPPDPDDLPPPPQLEWSPLGPRDSGDPSNPQGAPEYVPPPQAEASVAPPPAPVVETPVSGIPDPSAMELAKPDVEIWRDESQWPQIPARRSNQLDPAYVTGTEPVWLNVQFNPVAAGKKVFVKPGRGITLDPPASVLTVSATGECVVLAQIAEGLARSHIVFYCEGVKTILPVLQASLAKVEEQEALTGGGQ